MALPVVKEHRLGELICRTMDFADVDDVLPMHSHTRENVHITVIGRGSFKAHGQGWERVVKAGDLVNFEEGKPHELIALEADSRLINIIKYPSLATGPVVDY